MKKISNDVLLVELPSNSLEIANELKAVNEAVSKDNNQHIIIDFLKVEIINSANISNLLILRSLLENSDHRLIFFNVATVTKCIFVVAGLNEVFDFVDDRSSALAAVQHVGEKTG